MNINAINFHLTKYCNYRCKFCFATFMDKPLNTNLSKEEMLSIIKECAINNINKISFAGGEPMLCPWLDELIVYAKELGLTTMLITNGSLLTKKWIDSIKDSLDWITLSVDSLKKESLISIGRVQGNKFLSNQDLYRVVNLIKSAKIKFKINTVVNQVNYTEDLSSFIQETQPERWKIFQVLPIKGQSDLTIDEMIVHEVQFQEFVNLHRKADLKNTNMVVEDNNLMTGSYLMIDPFGRFYDNIFGRLKYSRPILEAGYKNALEEVFVSSEKFISRNGNWDWR